MSPRSQPLMRPGESSPMVTGNALGTVPIRWCMSSTCRSPRPLARSAAMKSDTLAAAGCLDEIALARTRAV